MSKSQRRAKRKVLRQRGTLSSDDSEYEDSILGRDSGQILLTQDSLISISNIVGRKLKRKLSNGEIAELDRFIGRLPPSQFEGQSLSNAQQKVADQFMYRHNMWEEVPEEQEDLAALTKLDTITDDPDIKEYQKLELNGLTTNENPLKYGMYHDRRGNSAVDRDRAGDVHLVGRRSGPNNIATQELHDMRDGAGGGEGASAATTAAMARNQHRVNQELIKYLRALNGMFTPEAIEEIFQRSRSSLITFQSVVLPHQIVPLDSRFRLVEYNSVGSYKWNIHTSNDPGRPGDIRMLDTITEVMQMKICPFWIPVAESRHQFYSKIRMFIKEFKQQSIQVNEFEDCDQGCVPRTHNYHFEFLIDRRETNRIHLIPVCDTFKFRKPMAQVNTMTLEFRAPFEKIEFDIDRLPFTISNTNPALFTASESHNLATGDLVYVCNFSSNQANALAAQRTNREVNRYQGHFITRISDTEFTIPIDLSVEPSDVDNIEVQFGSKRIITQIELISLEQ
jgi:hypothetical protein